MNLQTVISNIERTIAGKKNLLSRIQGSGSVQDVVTSEYLSLNIGELERIRDDLVLCRKKEIDQDWLINPERMGR